MTKSICDLNFCRFSLSYWSLPLSGKSIIKQFIFFIKAPVSICFLNSDVRVLRFSDISVAISNSFNSIATLVLLIALIGMYPSEKKAPCFPCFVLSGLFSKNEKWICLLSVFSCKPANQVIFSGFKPAFLKNLGNSVIIILYAFS